MRIWTIGHSTRSIDTFISLLKANGITVLADVRTWPGSKRYPQFNKEKLSHSLGKAGIRYEHFPELGGRRKAKPDSKTQPGEMNHFAVTPITWRQKSSTKVLSAFSILLPLPALLRSCAQKRSGGVVIGR